MDDKQETWRTVKRRSIGGLLIGSAALAQSIGALIAVKLIQSSWGLFLIAGGETALGGLLGVSWIYRSKIWACIRWMSGHLIGAIRTNPGMRTFFIMNSIVMNVAYIYSVTHVSIGMYVTLELFGLLVFTAGEEFARNRHWAVLGWASIMAVLVVIFTEPWAGGRADLLPMAAGLLVGAGMAARMIATRHLDERTANSMKHSGSFVGGFLLLAGAMVMPQRFGGVGSAEISVVLILILLLCGLLTTMLPQVFEIMAAGRGLTESAIGVVFCMSPAIGAAVGWAFLGQSLSPIQMVLLPLIVVTAIGATWATGKRTRSRQLN